MKPLTLRRVLWSCALLAALLLGIVLLALRLGAVPFSFGDLGQNLWWLVTGQPGKISTDFRLIMVDIRLPRILLGIVVGAALSVAGAGFQALLRNPLADPYVLGVSSGAAVGAILALLAAPARAGVDRSLAIAAAMMAEEQRGRTLGRPDGRTANELSPWVLESRRLGLRDRLE